MTDNQEGDAEFINNRRNNNNGNNNINQNNNNASGVGMPCFNKQLHV